MNTNSSVDHDCIIREFSSIAPGAILGGNVEINICSAISLGANVIENISIGNISGGLYEKMISSGAGLIVGLIAYAGYHLLNGKIDHFMLNVQKQVLEFVNIIQRPNGN